jgi:HK97 gp10 family phage protein
MISLTGKKEIDAALRGLPLQLQDSVLKNAHSDAAKPLIQTAKNIVPVKTGNLKNSIGVERLSIKKTNEAGVISVGPRRKGGNKGFHAHLIEYGKKNRDGSMSKKTPFMEPAFNQTKGEVEKRIATSLERKVTLFLRRTLKNG